MSRASMCVRKASFRTWVQAQRVADKFGQRVYECPICFCWHCTTKERWQDEFIRMEDHIVAMTNQESQIRGELNEKNRRLTQQVFDLQQENKRLKKGLT